MNPGVAFSIFGSPKKIEVYRYTLKLYVFHGEKDD